MSDEGLDSDISAHFGSCPYFTLVDITDGVIDNVEAVKNGTHEGGHDCMAPAYLLNKNAVNVVLVSGIGGRPLMGLKSQNIRVYGGAFGKVGDAVVDMDAGLLDELADRGTCNCSHHED